MAARRLALAADPRVPDPSQDPDVLAIYRERFSFVTVGGRYRTRLEELWADREGVGARLRWRGDRSPVGW